MNTLRNISVLLAVIFTYSAIAQTQIAKVDSYKDQDEMMVDLMTHQYDNFETVDDESDYIPANEYSAMVNEKSKNVNKQFKENKDSGDMLHKEDNQVCDIQEYVYIDEYGSARLTRDLVASNVDFNKRYVSCREKDSIVEANLEKEKLAKIQGPKNESKILAAREVEDLDNNVIDQLIITDNGEYLYRDGIELKGDEELKEELSDGKPITELTFYYELIDAGIIQDSISARDFTQMSVDEQSKLLSYNR